MDEKEYFTKIYTIILIYIPTYNINLYKGTYQDTFITGLYKKYKNQRKVHIIKQKRLTTK